MLLCRQCYNYNSCKKYKQILNINSKEVQITGIECNNYKSAINEMTRVLNEEAEEKLNAKEFKNDFDMKLFIKNLEYFLQGTHFTNLKQEIKE